MAKAISRSDREHALKALIRDTIADAGDLSPDEIPHRVKARLKDQAVGDAELERLIRDAVAGRKKSAG